MIILLIYLSVLRVNTISENPKKQVWLSDSEYFKSLELNYFNDSIDLTAFGRIIRNDSIFYFEAKTCIKVNIVDTFSFGFTEFNFYKSGDFYLKLMDSSLIIELKREVPNGGICIKKNEENEMLVKYTKVYYFSRVDEVLFKLK